MNDNVLRLTGEQVDEVTLVDSGNKYKSGKKSDDGKTFSRFRYNGIIFTVDDDSDFIAHHKAGTITSAKLITGKRTVVMTDEKGDEISVEKDTLTFDSFISYDKEENRLKHSVKMEALRGISAVGLTEDMMKQLAAVGI